MKPLSEITKQVLAEHQKVVTLHILDMPITRNERAVLSALDGLTAMIGHDSAKSPFFAEHVTYPMLRSFGDLLNHDCGRLDPSTLSAQAFELAERARIDLDTGKWVGEQW